MSTSKSEVGTIGPVEILGEASFQLDAAVQNSINQAVSRTTRSARQWDRKTLYAAYKAARPIVEQNLRAQGKAFTSAQVRATVRPYVKAYVDQFTVQTPPGSLIGATPLQAVAGEVLVGFAMPWQSFLPPQVQIAQKLASQGQPQAKSWLSKFFGGKKSAPVAAPATAPVAAAPTPGAAVKAPVAATPAAAVAPADKATAESEDSAGGSGDSLGAWLHRLNPGYWMHSAEERKLIDAEKQAWIDNAYNAKQEAKKQATVDIAMKALTAKQTAASAYAKTSELDAQLKAIESQVLGACAGDVGRQEILGAEPKANPHDGKVNPFEGDEIPDQDALPVVQKLAKARKLNAANAGDIKPLADKLSRGLPLSPDESSKLLVLLARNEQLHEFRKGIVSGDLYSTNPSAKKIKKQVLIGAAKAMTPSEQAMLAQIVAQAKTGNPNAKAALASLKAQGYAASMGASPAAMTNAEKQMLAQMIKSAKAGHHNSQQALMALKAQGYTFSLGGKSFVGWGVSDAFNLAMKPITMPAKYLWKGVKAVGRAVGITKGGSPSTEQVRLNRLQAAQKRIQAAQARAAAADAQSEAEFRVQQQLAAAADAEADAADAEAASKTAAMQAAEQQFMPGVAPQEEDDQSGAVKPVITPLPATLVTTSEKDAELERLMTKATKKTHASLMASRRAYVTKKNPKAAAILKASEEKTPIGMKLQAAMKMVVAYRAGDKQTKRAVDAMAARASKGDKQAKADMNAINAAIFAYNADQKAGKHVARVAAYKAATAKVVAVRTRASVAASDALIRNSRRRAFNQLVKLESKAAAGDKKAQAVVRKHVELAKKSDKKSQNLVNGLKTAQILRKTAPTRSEQRRIAQARRMARKYNAGNKKTVTDVRVMVAAAKHDNPNAKRGVDRLKKGAAVEKYLATGVFVVPAVVIVEKEKSDKKAANKKRLASIETKVNNGTASKEEAQAAAKLASDAGEHEKAKELATQAKSLPSAKDELQRVATIATAADAGHTASQASVDRALKAAAAGESDGIEAAGKLAGVQALHQVAQNKPLTPEMKTAVADLTAAQAGDEKAVEKIATMQAKAKDKDPEAIKYVAVAAGAAMVSRALADNPVAHDEWMVKAGVKPADLSKQEVPMKEEKAVVEYRPEEPLPPVHGFVGVIKAIVSSLIMTTRDPFQNYREGVIAMGQKKLLPMAADTAGADPKPTPEAAAWMAKRQAAQTAKEPSSVVVDPKIVAFTKTRLEAVKAAADKGDTGAKKKWDTANTNYKNKKALAVKGDEKAQTLVAVLEATGLFKS